MESLKMLRRVGMPFVGSPAAQLTRTTVRENMLEPGTQLRSLMALREHLGQHGVCPPAVCPMMDLTKEAGAFGAKVIYSDNEAPIVDKENPLLIAVEDARNLSVPSLTSGSIPSQLDIVRRLVKESDAPMKLAYIIGPYTLAARLRGEENFLTDILTNPDESKGLVNTTLQFLKDYARATIDTGINALFVLDPLTGQLGPDQVDEFSLPYLRELVETINASKKDGNFEAWLHNCGRYANMSAERFFAIGFNGLHVGNCVDIAETRDKTPEDRAFSGNLDPGFLYFDDPQEIYAKTTGMLERVGNQPNFIPSTGCDCPPISKLENVVSFYKAVQDFWTSIG